MENSLLDLVDAVRLVDPRPPRQPQGLHQPLPHADRKAGRRAAQAVLNARVRPFLARTKADVAADLPEKTEITEFVPLGDSQRGLYEFIRVTMDARVRDAITKKGLAASRITILDALLKLRQVCCDPELSGRRARRPFPRAPSARD